jgi:uncharacterized membrane protein YhdT
MSPDFITVAAQLVFGFLVKKWPALKAWPNKLIPVFNLALAVLLKLAGVGVASAQAVAEQGHPAHPGWLSVWCFVQPLLINTLISTGIFSAGKNINQHFSTAA